MSDITQENAPEDIQVGDIGNYYAGLWARSHLGKYYWSIETHSGYYWSEIPEYLFQALIQHEKERQAAS